jgi:hypothetical protein
VNILGTQVMDECRHYEVFCRRMADFGIEPEKNPKSGKNMPTVQRKSAFSKYGAVSARIIAAQPSNHGINRNAQVFLSMQ